MAKDMPKCPSLAPKLATYQSTVPHRVSGGLIPCSIRIKHSALCRSEKTVWGKSRLFVHLPTFDMVKAAESHLRNQLSGGFSALGTIQFGTHAITVVL